MSITKKIAIFGLALVMMAMVVPLTATANEMAEISKLKFASHNANYANNVLPELSAELGFYAKGGIKPDKVVFAEQSAIFPALMGGSLHVCLQDTDAVAGAHAAGAKDFLLIANYRDKEAWKFAIAKGKTIHTIKTASAGGSGGRNEFNSKDMVKRLGGDPEKIKWISIRGGSDSRVNAFVHGQIDGVNHFDRHHPLIEKAGGKTVYDEYEDVPQDGVVVLRSFAEKNPRTVINMLKAFIQARDFARDMKNKDKVIEIMRKRGYDIPESFAEGYKKAMFEISEDGHFTIESMEKLISDSVRTGSLVKHVDWRTFVDMSYLNTAYKELGMDDRVKDYGK